jgi:cell division protein FtsQ
VRSAVEALPWVDKVSIRRVWPDTLKVRVVEQQPLARWGQDALLNRQGEVFRPQPLPKLPQLALLEGEIADAKSISREYQRIETLMNTVGLKLSKVRVDARQAWLLQTRNGIELNLGRKRILPRLTRFVRLYPRLAATRQARLKLVDLRYPNGFSARWESLPEMQSNRHDPAEWGHASRLAGI